MSDTDVERELSSVGRLRILRYQARNPLARRFRVDR